MLWLVIPVLASIFYCIGSYSQNYLTDNALPKRRAGAYQLTRIVLHLAIIVILLAVFGRAAFMLPLANALGLIVSGAVNVIGAVYYFRALQVGDTADISIFGQIGPIISLGLGIMMLGETITANQSLGFVLIMAGVLSVILQGSGGKKRGSSADITTASLTIIATFFSVFSDILFVYFLSGTANYTLFAQSFFYFELGSLLATILLSIFLESWRKAIKTTFATGRKHKLNLSVAIFDNVVFGIADAFYKLALIIAPVKSLLSVIGKVASLFSSLFITIVFGRTFPHIIGGKRLTRQMIFRYIIASIIIISGVLLVNS